MKLKRIWQDHKVPIIIGAVVLFGLMVAIGVDR